MASDSKITLEPPPAVDPQAEGLSPDTFPVDYRGFDPEKGDEKWLPRAQALAASTSALREMMGRAVYGAVSRNPTPR
jgi:hypothetical protein